MTITWMLDTILRTVVIAGVAGLGLALFQVRSATVKLAVWRLVLFSSLLMPLASLLPKRAVVVVPRRANPVVARVVRQFSGPTFASNPGRRPYSPPVDWRGIALRSYALVAGLLALRTALGLLRLRHLGTSARPVPELGPEVFETAHVPVPVTYGVSRPRILLPVDWRNWTNETLGAVLAHERSHIAQRDFLTQCLSKLNRAMYWANPLAWWIDRELALLAEQISDDAALNRVRERPAYAAVLLHFAQQRANFASAAGVAMARPGGVASRIDRILDDAHSLSQPLSSLARVALATAAIVAIVAVGAFKLSTVAAQTNRQERRNTSVTIESDGVVIGADRNQPRWALVHRDGRSMDGGPGAWPRARALVGKTLGDYLWFIKDGQEYLIDDAGVIAEIESWFKPLEELGHEQGELGEKQGALGEEMGKLGEEMARLGLEMARVTVEMPDMKALRMRLEELNRLSSSSRVVSADALASVQNRLGELQNLLGQAQNRVGERQSTIGELQSKIGEKQSLLGAEQGKLGELQGKLGERQGKIAEGAEQRLRSLIDQAVRDGRAKPVR